MRKDLQRRAVTYGSGYIAATKAVAANHLRSLLSYTTLPVALLQCPRLVIQLLLYRYNQTACKITAKHNDDIVYKVI